MFNLEVGLPRMEIGKSEITIKEAEQEQDMERKKELLWQHADEDLGNGQISFNAKIDEWDDIIMRDDEKIQIENENEDYEGKFNELVEEAPEIEGYLFNGKFKPNSEKPKDETREIDEEKEEQPLVQGDVIEESKKRQEHAKAQIENHK
ncbi:hypothetical protein OXYTRIMIC_247 [Oxytricha trifallax]|uniref:Uncharacterized protein n=1 Tax=Oxytricha trifallax TaxID=1172189 RepID=A0A073ICJ2_9SPIT|nr:hypothetical protein OXYTRIMIC_247 [Oxytricha trifallax]